MHKCIGDKNVMPMYRKDAAEDQKDSKVNC